ncbi:hypothetical protein C2845_PM08G13250 [Panicum miliaceum]|uniref:Uncharacterized protein n=1 Tax=Panicum miliaceum TaxID=4540 RepID=A0A3L6QZF0_PANMI|nr:hypothetical protein C2845_PM08G13250 [Panicum miliaceum]
MYLPLQDNNKGWHNKWFIVSNPASSLPPKIRFPLVHKAYWDDIPMPEEMTQVDVLLSELASLKATGLTATAVTLSFYKRLT